MKQPIKFGKYYLLERINVGGMAEVFKAKSFGVEGFEKLIAIKRILPNIAEDEDFITMFIDEAKIAVQLNHANIAQIFDLGKIEDSYFIALEFVHGKDLRTIWERHKRRGLRLPIPMSAYVTSRVCEGLDYAHRKKDASGRDLNIVHRDVSPQNILLSYEGEVKIIDFGIAKAANKASKTQAGILKGKFGYMSPEQVRGLPLDRRSDIFSVGIILYELLTGERLFVGESDFSTLEKVRNVEILPPSTYNRNIPDSLEKIVLKALSKDPDDRFKSAYDMQEELQRFLILSKSNFARKDLSAYMKRAFKSDIERELERHKQYELLTSAAEGSFMEEPDLPTDRFSRPDLKLDETEKPVIPSIAPPDDDDDDDDVETMVWDPRQGLPEDQGTQQEEPASRPPPRERPPARPSSRSRPPPRKPVSESRKPPPYKPPEEDPVFDDESGVDTLTGSTPEPKKPLSLADDLFSTGEATLSDESPVTRKRSSVNMVIVILAVVAVGVFGFAVFKYLQQQGLLGGGAILVVQSTPANARLWLDGNEIQGRAEDLKPGAHLLEAKADNYQPYKEEIQLTAGQQKSVSISLQFVPAVVEIEITPPNAVVKMDGKKIGERSPVRLEDVLPGVKHTFVFEHTAYVTQTTEWTLKPREIRNEKIVLEEKLFDLDIDTIPSGARITLDDTPKGKAPRVIKGLKATKRYQLMLQLRGHNPWSGTIFFDGSDTKTVRPRLESLSGSVAPETRKVSPGHATRTPAHKPAPKPETLKKEKKTSSVDHGVLRLNSVPWGKVFINGKDIGKNTPLPMYTLPAGAYTVTVEFASGGKKSTHVDIFPGQTTKKVIKKE